MNRTTYENLLSKYNTLFDNGMVKMGELKKFLSKEIKIECDDQADSSIEYFLFGKKMRTELHCSFSDIRSRKGHIITFIEVEDENRNNVFEFIRERWFDDEGNVEKDEDYPEGYFMEICESFTKKFSVRRLNLIQFNKSRNRRN